MFNRKKRTIVELERRVRSLEGSLRFAHKEYELKTGEPFPLYLSSLQWKEHAKKTAEKMREFLDEELMPRITAKSKGVDQ